MHRSRIWVASLMVLGTVSGSGRSAAAPAMPASGVLRATTASSAGDDSWPMPGHDPGQSNANPARGYTPGWAGALHLIWRRPHAIAAAEADGRFYLIDQASDALLLGGSVRAVVPRTGAIVHRYLSPMVRTVSVADGQLYFNRGSEIRIIDAATAAWRSSATLGAGPSGAPSFQTVVAAGGQLFTMSSTQNIGAAGLYSFAGRDGRLLWETKDNFASTPAVVGTRLYYGVGLNGIGSAYVRDVRMGRLLQTRTGFGQSSWHLAGERLYADVLIGPPLAPRRWVIRAYDRTGAPRWILNHASFLAALPDRVIALSPDTPETAGLSITRYVGAYRASDGRLLWRTSLPVAGDWHTAPVALAGRLVAIGLTKRRVGLLDAETGRRVATLVLPQPNQEVCTLIVAAAMLDVGSSTACMSGTAAQWPTVWAFGP